MPRNWRESQKARFRVRVVLLYMGSLLGLFSFFAAGCTVSQKTQGRGFETYQYRELPQKYQDKAISYESAGMLQEALQCWIIVRYFHPDDAKIKQKIEVLRQRSRARAGEHFTKGVQYYQNGREKKARKEFLLTLSYKPNHSQALLYLKEKLDQPVFEDYVTRRGDTVQKIAVKELGDGDKAFLLTAFNKMDGSAVLPPGKTIRIPIFKSLHVKKHVARSGGYVNERPGRGKAANTMNTVQQRASTDSEQGVAPETVQSVIKEDGEEKNAAENYRRAKELFEKEEYWKALQILHSLDVDYRDVGILTDSAKVFLKQEADAHYRKGIRYFLAENLEKAIEEWEEVLRIDPDHLKAKKDLKNAKRLLKRLN